jgi:hypothetical protein
MPIGAYWCTTEDDLHAEFIRDAAGIPVELNPFDLERNPLREGHEIQIQVVSRCGAKGV